MPAGKGIPTRCLIIRSGSRWEYHALQSSPITLCMGEWKPRVWERMWERGKKWLFFLHKGEKTFLPITNKEREERNFTSEGLPFVNIKCTRLWKLKEEVKQDFAVGNILTNVCSVPHSVYHTLSTIFHTMFSTLDYSTGGIENKPICETKVMHQ